jgi:capsid portal protein
MNRHIKNLAKQAFINLEKDPIIINNPKDLRHFAELIIKECIDNVYCADFGDFYGQSYYMDKVAEHLEKHFDIK